MPGRRTGMVGARHRPSYISRLGTSGREDATAAGDGPDAPRGTKHTAPLAKTELCIAWSRGLCQFGDRCLHAHGARELRAKPPEGRPAVSEGPNLHAKAPELDATIIGLLRSAREGSAHLASTRPLAERSTAERSPAELARSLADYDAVLRMASSMLTTTKGVHAAAAARAAVQLERSHVLLALERRDTATSALEAALADATSLPSADGRRAALEEASRRRLAALLPPHRAHEIREHLDGVARIAGAKAATALFVLDIRPAASGGESTSLLSSQQTSHKDEYHHDDC